ncbi:MAG: MerR family transcriptional regulator [Anaerolineaceae bacterium]|nr:MerR family transcriptional regulator [Phototrophicus methaneseepsis]MAU11804.1 MerR family transcriptional regulator [Anaerolineaceae bacterium]
MKIGELAERTNTPASTIRYYERAGVLPKPERISGQRQYDEKVIEELEAIKIAQNLGFNLDEIKLLLETFRSSQEPSEECRNLTQQKLVEIDKIIAEAQNMKRILEHGITCNCASLQGCYLQEEKELATDQERECILDQLVDDAQEQNMGYND